MLSPVRVLARPWDYDAATVAWAREHLEDRINAILEDPGLADHIERTNSIVARMKKRVPSGG